MKTIEVNAVVKVPCEATDEQIKEWVHFSLHNGSIAIANPLSNYDLDAYGYINIRTLS